MATSILDLMGHVQKQGEIGRERGQNSRLSRLYSQAIEAPQDQRRGILAQIAQTSPDAAVGAQKSLSALDADSAASLSRDAGMFVALAQSGDEQATSAAYQRLAQKAMGLGMAVPPTYDPKYLPMIEKIAAVAGGGNELKSLRIGANGNYWAIRGGQFVDTGTPAAPTNQVIDTGNGFFGVDKRTLQAAPVMVGGQMQQRAPGEVPFSIDPSLPPEVQAQIRANPDAGSAQGITSLPQATGGSFGGGQQLRSAPKPSDVADTFVPLSQDEITQLGMPAGTVAQRNLKTGKVEVLPGAVQPKSLSPSQQMKLDQNRKKETRMVESMDASFDNSIRLIDEILSKRDDFGGVTGIGAIGAKIPGTDWADLEAKLNTLRARSAFGSLQEMRANSPTGGALGQVSERELDLLMNAETQLKNSQSPEALAAALENYKRILMDSKRRLRGGVEEFYDQAGSTSESPQTNSVLRYNPATGEFE